jgi:hypothetical protein
VVIDEDRVKVQLLGFTAVAMIVSGVASKPR